MLTAYPSFPAIDSYGTNTHNTVYTTYKVHITPIHTGDITNKEKPKILRRYERSRNTAFINITVYNPHPEHKYVTNKHSIVANAKPALNIKHGTHIVYIYIYISQHVHSVMWGYLCNSAPPGGPRG